jgi:hypothetical protein
MNWLVPSGLLIVFLLAPPWARQGRRRTVRRRHVAPVGRCLGGDGPAPAATKAVSPTEGAVPAAPINLSQRGDSR